MTEYYIGHSTDENIRYKSSSGGIGTAIIKYLLSTTDYNTSMTFFFDKEKCAYDVKLIHSFEEYNNCGSIYQDINIALFIRQNISCIKGGMVVCCPPCQVAVIRNMLDKAHIKNFIISFCCSGQTTIEGTWCYYKFLGIDKCDVIYMQYRGNGWPSGIQIKLKDGRQIYHDNYTEPWVTIHKSQLFRPKRCFSCKLDTGRNADISIADPWLKEYIGKEKVGSTLFLVNTPIAQKVISLMTDIEYFPSSYEDYAIAQKPNVHKFISVNKRKKKVNILDFSNYAFYKKIVSSSMIGMRFHIVLDHYMNALSCWDRYILLMLNIFNKISNYYRNRNIRRKIGSFRGRFYVSSNVTMLNPQCVHLGEGVGIGENTYLGPVIEYASIVYAPKIIIGDGTWIGKHCSIAAIDKVEIGKRVLFAGYVHITDHSHGYEDISKSIFEQKLISKGPVIIDDECWLGFSCEILSGVHIGKHSIVAARAVVTKDVPPYSIVAGNPARIVKQYDMETKTWKKVSNFNII